MTHEEKFVYQNAQRYMYPIPNEKRKYYEFCWCKSDKRDSMIECSGKKTTCPGNNWYHFNCIGINSDVAEKLKEFICLACEAQNCHATKTNTKVEFDQSNNHQEQEFDATPDNQTTSQASLQKELTRVLKFSLNKHTQFAGKKLLGNKKEDYIELNFFDKDKLTEKQWQDLMFIVGTNRLCGVLDNELTGDKYFLEHTLTAHWIGIAIKNTNEIELVDTKKSSKTPIKQIAGLIIASDTDTENLTASIDILCSTAGVKLGIGAILMGRMMLYLNDMYDINTINLHAATEDNVAYYNTIFGFIPSNHMDATMGKNNPLREKYEKLVKAEGKKQAMESILKVRKNWTKIHGMQMQLLELSSEDTISKLIRDVDKRESKIIQNFK